MEVNKMNIEIDEDGFLIELNDWTVEIAAYLAALDKIYLLTPDHWKVIYYLRDYFNKFGSAPMTRKLCKETGFTFKEIRALFSCSCIRGVYKVAGLPKPTGCI